MKFGAHKDMLMTFGEHGKRAAFSKSDIGTHTCL